MEMEYIKSYRLDLSKWEFEQLETMINYASNQNNLNLETVEGKQLYAIAYNYKTTLNKMKQIKYSHKKTKAMQAATDSRSQKAKEKIQNAINILRMENKKITPYSVSKLSKVSFNTVKKYKDLFNEMK